MSAFFAIRQNWLLTGCRNEHHSKTELRQCRNKQDRGKKVRQCRNRQDEEGKKGLGGGFLDDFETVGGDFHVGAAEVVDADADVGGVVATKADNMALKAGLLPA